MLPILRCSFFKTIQNSKLISKSLIISSQFATSNDSTINPEKLVEFFQKAERTISEEQKLESVAILEAKDSDTPEHSDAKITSDNVSEDKVQRPTAVSFVPWSLGKLLREMNIRRLPSRRSKYPEKSFAALLRNSPFVQLGNFKSRELIGVVIENVDNKDLYIDFGGKFHCVCEQPPNQFYPRGSLVRIRLRDPEMTNRFMINTKGISLLEADAVLLGPYKGRLTRSTNEETSVPSVPGDEMSPTRQASDADSVSIENWRIL